jgi:MinD-like ATPase involved in chromosome partitioning or flagellar assembly
MGIRIQKDRISVIVMTEQYRIEGEIHVVAGGRVIDEINKEKDFIPLTNVTVYDAATGNSIDTVEFIAIQKQAVVFVAPTSSTGAEF